MSSNNTDYSRLTRIQKLNLVKSGFKDRIDGTLATYEQYRGESTTDEEDTVLMGMLSTRLKVHFSEVTAILEEMHEANLYDWLMHEARTPSGRKKLEKAMAGAKIPTPPDYWAGAKKLSNFDLNDLGASSSAIKEFVAQLDASPLHAMMAVANG